MHARGGLARRARLPDCERSMCGTLGALQDHRRLLHPAAQAGIASDFFKHVVIQAIVLGGNCQVKSSQVKSSQVKSSQVKSSQVKSSQVKSSPACHKAASWRSRQKKEKKKERKKERNFTIIQNQTLCQTAVEHDITSTSNSF